jgi:hypothetical protein
MTVVGEIVCSVAQEEATQAAVKTFCKETGGQLIGRRDNEKAQKVQLIIWLPLTAHVSKQAIPLQALQQQVRKSFRYLTYDLVQISFGPSVNLQEQMQKFPLRAEETWFPAIHDQRQAYMCMSRPFILAKQAAWLLANEVQWEFV